MTGLAPISYRRLVYYLLNVLIKTANKMELQKTPQLLNQPYAYPDIGTSTIDWPNEACFYLRTGTK
jgi:hypothetical protein